MERQRVNTNLLGNCLQKAENQVFKWVSRFDIGSSRTFKPLAIEMSNNGPLFVMT